ncbi:MAG: glycoside hydrolase family 3 C-terminal domain-containing protein [Candidatus Acidiferrales bacterium]|jgi:beta-glucosidase
MRKRFGLIVAVFAVAVAALAQDVARTPADVESRVESILSRMTLEEKIDLISGVDDYFVRGVPRLGVPRLKMADGPIGVRNFGPATTMAGGIALAAAWDPQLAVRVGTEIGRDARAKGIHFLLGPGLNLYRAPMNGRNFEYFGEDPFLASRIAVGYVKGVQSQGVSATIKHFMGNNSEFDRHNTDDIIDERTLRELYLPAFEAAVTEAHAGAVMNSYNLTNGEHMTQNAMLDTDILKKEWGFDGVLMSDWDATYDGVAAANAGLDLEMPSGKFMNRATLEPALQQGLVTQAAIDDKVHRILRDAVRFGWLDRDQLDLSIPRYNQQGREVALQAAQEAMVLLKNDDGLLPLSEDAIHSVAVIGPDAYPAVPVGGGSGRVEPFHAISFLEGISNYLGAGVKVFSARGVPSIAELADATQFSTSLADNEAGLRAEYFSKEDLSGSADVVRVDTHVNFGSGSSMRFAPNTLSTRWTGYFTPQSAGAHDIVVQSTGEDGGHYRVYVDDALALDQWTLSTAKVDRATLGLTAAPHKIVIEQRGRSDWLGGEFRIAIVAHGNYVEAAAKQLAARADVVVVAAGFDAESESEGSDRTFGLPPGQDELIQAMAAANKKTIVVVTSGGAVDMRAWLDQVPALIEAWYPGQEGGTALAEILFGEVDPSGRLPVTFDRSWDESPVHDSYYPAEGTTRVAYSEGVFSGYRGYDHAGRKPLFPFGYGLSYTTFSFANLAVTPSATHDGRFDVSFDLTNTGAREGAEVAEVYVGDLHASVPRPPQQLEGFARVDLKPQETRRVTVSLNRRSLSYYDVAGKAWRADPGEFRVLVGRSDGDIVLRGTLTLLPGETTPASAAH